MILLYFQEKQKYHMKPESYPLRLLSHCLYYCTDKKEFNRYFNEYYQYISKILMRHIKRQLLVHGYRGDLDAASADLWRDIFDEHYQSIFIRRTESAERIQELTGSIKLTSRGELFSRQTHNWGREVENWTHTVMTFLNKPVLLGDDASQLEQQAQETNRPWSSLRDQGYELLVWLLPQGHASTDNESVVDEITSETDDDAANHYSEEDSNSHTTHDKYRHVLKRRIAELEQIKNTENEAEADRVAGCQGGVRFGVNTTEILNQLPRVLIPIMPTLYWLANNRTLDFLRRVDRDPICNQIELVSHNSDNADEPDELLDDYNYVESNENYWGIWNKLRTLLKRPVIEAQAALQQPGLTEKQLRSARNKLCNCENRYSLHLSVIELIGKEYSQEDIGAHLGLTRDQVRGRIKEIHQLLEPLRDMLEPKRARK